MSEISSQSRPRLDSYQQRESFNSPGQRGESFNSPGLRNGSFSSVIDGRQRLNSTISNEQHAGWIYTQRDTNLVKDRYTDVEYYDTRGTTNKFLKAMKKQGSRKYQMQAFVILLAVLRYYLLGMLELNNQINKISGQKTNISLLISSIAFLIFGQLIDN